MALLVAEEHFELFWLEGERQFRLKYINAFKIETKFSIIDQLSKSQS